MKNRLALIVAVILGLIAIYGIRRYMLQHDKDIKEKFPTQNVVVAATLVKAGTAIKPSMLAAEALQESAISGDHILWVDRDTLTGRTINRTVERRAPLLNSYFRQPIVHLENRLRREERAVTLQVNSVTGVAGNIVPGSYVDILGTFVADESSGKATTVGGRTGEPHTVLLLSNVKVLAVDRRTQEVRYVTAEDGTRGRSYSTVTVAVKPDEASILVHAQQAGILTLTLRPPADVSLTPMADINAKNLLEQAAAAERARRAARKNEAPMSVAPGSP